MDPLPIIPEAVPVTPPHDAPRARGPIAAFVVFGAYWGGWAAVVPAVQRHAHASDAQLGIAMLCLALASLPAMLATGALAARQGLRSIAVVATLMAVLGVMPSLATSPFALALATAAIGAASGAMDVAINAGVAIAERGGRHLMPLAHALFSAGFFAGSALGGIARQSGASPTTVMLAGSVLYLGIAAVNTDGRHGTPRDRAPRLALSRALVLLGVVGACSFFVEASIEGWSAIHLERTLHATAALAAAGPATYAAAMVLGRLGTQLVGRRIDARLLFLGGGVAAAGGCLALATADTIGVALVALALTGLGVAAVAPGVYGLATRAPGQAPATALSTVTTVAYLGGLVGPPIIGGLAQSGGLRVALAAVAVPGVAIALGALAPRWAPAGARER